MNGVKIAVPVAKMAVEDLEYVEKATGVSLDEDKPLSDIKRRSTQRAKDGQKKKNGVSFADSKPEYDWFDFFLQAGVNPQICERYASAFQRDQMGEEVLPDVEPPLLRTLGLKEGDILRVMKFLDAKFGRTAKRNLSVEGPTATDQQDPDAIEPVNGASGGLFSGPGGTLRNNTRKGRPAPAVQTNDVVDPKVFEQKTGETKKAPPSEATATPLTSAPPRAAVGGFDDDAWDLKPAKTPTAPVAVASTAPVASSTPAPAPAPLQRAPTGAMSELSLLSPPLEPSPAPQPAQQPSVQPQQPVRTGADPSFFDKLAAPAPVQPLQPQQTAAPRQRPQAPPQMQTGGSFIQPPPARASSAPGFPQQSTFAPPPLQPQLTGYQGPVGQSLQELQQQRMQQQQFGQQAMQPQMTGFPQQQNGFSQMQDGMMPQPTGYNQFQSPQQTGFPQFQQPQQTGFQPSVQQQFMNGTMTGSPFADPPRQPFQPTPSGLQQSFSPQQSLQPQQTGFMMPQATGMPLALQPQQTGLPPALQPQQTGINGFGQQPQQFGQNGFQAPPMPPMPPQQTGIQPLVPQKTGPPPPVRFGVQPGANKLTPQPTGRRANLSHASKSCPIFNTIVDAVY